MEEARRTVLRPTVKDTDAAIITYYNGFMGNQDIMKIFGCSEQQAVRIKKAIRAVEIERGQQTVVRYHVKSAIAFEALDIDIEQLIKGRNRMIKLGLK